MDGEQRLIIMLCTTAIIAVSIVGVALLVALWPYRLIVGAILVACLVVIFCLLTVVIVNEQWLRHKRVKYRSELPLDFNGKPLYLYENMKRFSDYPHDDE